MRGVIYSCYIVLALAARVRGTNFGTAAKMHPLDFQTYLYTSVRTASLKQLPRALNMLILLKFLNKAHIVYKLLLFFTRILARNICIRCNML